MFTGLIEKTGEIISLERRGGAGIIRVGHQPWDTAVRQGDSICVSGACLTVTSCDEAWFECQALDETLERTCLGSKRQGAVVNLERALRVGDRLGGHLVTGHVDGVGRIRHVATKGADIALTIEHEATLSAEIATKGSIACDGISLTVAAAGKGYFETRIISFTWDHTALKHAADGQPVNLETDILAKYVTQRLGNQLPYGTVDMQTLGKSGFLDRR